ncbi:MAG TPA: hypothetical protein VNT01_02785 [Symbiobacteriaceae bacterium]|nr:hypothetical protein [Symbiobacteriaceae bacterium]
MDETQDEQRQERPPAAAAIYEFGTWRQVQAVAVRRTATQGRPTKKKGG